METIKPYKFIPVSNTKIDSINIETDILTSELLAIYIAKLTNNNLYLGLGINDCCEEGLNLAKYLSDGPFYNEIYNYCKSNFTLIYPHLETIVENGIPRTYSLSNINIEPGTTLLSLSSKYDTLYIISKIKPIIQPKVKLDFKASNYEHIFTIPKSLNILSKSEFIKELNNQ